MKLLTMQFSPTSCNLIPLGPNVLVRHPESERFQVLTVASMKATCATLRSAVRQKFTDVQTCLLLPS
jgi:hypothetical protein